MTTLKNPLSIKIINIDLFVFTWMVKSTTDLYSSQLTVKADSPWWICCDFAGILLTPFSTSIYKQDLQLYTMHSNKVILEEWIEQE